MTWPCSAGHLREAPTEAARTFEAGRDGPQLSLVYGASGLLRERIAATKPAQLFVSDTIPVPWQLPAAGAPSGHPHATRCAP